MKRDVFLEEARLGPRSDSLVDYEEVPHLARLRRRLREYSLVDLAHAVMLTETIIASLLAVVLGTPGCEVGVWPELIARARNRRSTAGVRVVCVVGLHILDRWEARRRRVGAGNRTSRRAER